MFVARLLPIHIPTGPIVDNIMGVPSVMLLNATRQYY